MTRSMTAAAKRPRISLDVEPGIRRRLRLAAAKRDLTVREYVVDALSRQIREDIGEEREDIAALSGASDPVLDELWDNDKDAAYDRL